VGVFNAFLLFFFAKKGLEFRLPNRIDNYLVKTYSSEELPKIITNYFWYQKKYLQNIPTFSMEAQLNDPTIKKYHDDVLKYFMHILIGGICYAIILFSFSFIIFIY
jgi:hypothetical protein